MDHAFGKAGTCADAEIAVSIETVAPEDKVQLMKTIKDGIDRSKQAMENSNAKLEQDIQDANRSFHAEMDLMNEWHERMKAQDLILDKRKEIHVRLPTNQVITPSTQELILTLRQRRRRWSGVSRRLAGIKRNF
ncbi:hypothetical protein AA0113_g4613 [Alternaria arborescens]|uniref:Uncharacterized protein n=1 Tax=Alternaria arborescens TaxID=156630 RepID=A0A4Q4SCE5_9PLEO|nr:hypothetical protein AA0113_g4613 [Alternaria arborescens]